MARTAIIAGAGDLPGFLAGHLKDPVVAHLDGYRPEGEFPALESFRVERLAPFLARLHELGVSDVIFAGAIQRPRLDPEQFDPQTAMMVPRILAAMQQGDDATLRAVIAIFEEDGFSVLGVPDVAPDLLPAEGVLSTRQPDARDRQDAARAAAIVAALGAVDVGQGVVVARGLCLAVEALPGTDVMLRQVAALDALRPGGAGLLFKAAKAGQDRRIDLPALGAQTVRLAHAAGLAGVAFAAGDVLLLDRDGMTEEADRLGLFLWSRGSE
ncbi:LpxI family protein [Halodurantibacterium flavum]|uniref:LpxI family protein n=1 Tax=Halodurantibacterium flavum TaxID=1382802 RepID=A0ABW4SA90_9RHOB